MKLEGVIRNLTVRRKLVTIMMVTSTVALLLACTVFIAYDAFAYRREMSNRLASLAGVIGNNLTAAIDFNDPVAANETLAALRGEPHVIQAHVHTPDVGVFADYLREGASPLPEIEPAGDGHVFEGGVLHYQHTIEEGGVAIGTIELVMDLGELQGRTRRYIGIAALVFSISLLATAILSARLQRVISGPVLHLARTARAVAAERNYSIRARKCANDEIGELIDGFNAMLCQIAQRDEALEAARCSLELRVEERTRELAGYLSLLTATLDSMADGILAVDRSGAVTSHNQRFLAIWGIPTELMQTRNGEALIEFASQLVQDRACFIKRVREILASPEQEAFDVIALNDGRTLERTAHPQRVGDACVGVVLNFRDVTARKKAEESLEHAHRELLETSRMAGMAEVATGVLHNVGNVVNSVNVSCTIIAERIRRSEVRNLARVCALLKTHEADIGAFISMDPKGRRIPAFLEALTGQLAHEQEELIGEVDQLRKSVEHIKDIVAMQQSYAKVSGIAEEVSLVDLVEDAVRMNAGALVRHEVELVRDFQANPTISVEKHKVLQILVNLIRNAKYACDESGRSDRRITIRVTATDEVARIMVIDNGVGIAPENLTRIFSHGFTTRKNGHGFGLHSGALAAKELGGKLIAHSDGTGRGAVFTLELHLAIEPAAV